MDREKRDFIEILKNHNYPDEFEEIQGKMVIDQYRDVYLHFLREIPEDLIFLNSKDVHLDILEGIPQGIIFRNGGDIYLESLEKLSKGVRFENGGDLFLSPQFENMEIEEIDQKRYLNVLIEQMYG